MGSTAGSVECSRRASVQARRGAERGAPRTSRGTERMAVTEPRPHATEPPRSAASNLRTEAMPVAPVSPRPAVLGAAPPVQERASSPLERRSTNAPVESTVMRPGRSRRALPVVAIAGSLVALGLAAASWLLFERTGRDPDRTSAAAAPGSASATAVARRLPSVSTVAPPVTSAAPAPSARRPHPRRP